ncbi:MAG: glycosyltransferase family 39 protein [Candidatus Aenigmarchaeota archaeon]|nr:glycosyltransferase family 39 protein [Candidatus Aenigmarchaeota archaeon]
MRIEKIHLVLLVFFLVSVIHMVTKFHFILWDEAVYIGIGKYLFSNGAIGLFEVIRPPGLPMILGLLWFFGAGKIIIYDLIITLFSLGNIYLAYLIGKKLFGEKEGLVASVILAITPVFLYNSFRIMTEIPSAFFVLFAVYLYTEKRPISAGVSAGLAVTFRFTSGIILPAIILLVFLESRKKPEKMVKSLLFLLAGFIVIVSPYLFYNQYYYGDPFYSLSLAGQHSYNPVHAINDPLTNVLYYPSAMFWDNMLLSFALFSLIYAADNKKVRNMLLIAGVCLAVFTLIPNKQIRFGLTFLPFLSVLASFGLLKMREYMISLKRKPLTVLFSVMVILAVSASLYGDLVRFNSFPSEKPDIVDEYYMYFEGFDGTILTSDPVHVAYSDISMIPYYNNITDAHLIYDRYSGSSDYVVFSFNPFPCFDGECETLREELFDKIGQNELYFNKTYEETKYIYRVKKSAG